MVSEDTSRAILWSDMKEATSINKANLLVTTVGLGRERPDIESDHLTTVMAILGQESTRSSRLLQGSSPLSLFGPFIYKNIPASRVG